MLPLMQPFFKHFPPRLVTSHCSHFSRTSLLEIVDGSACQIFLFSSQSPLVYVHHLEAWLQMQQIDLEIETSMKFQSMQQIDVKIETSMKLQSFQKAVETLRCSKSCLMNWKCCKIALKGDFTVSMGRLRQTGVVQNIDKLHRPEAI